MQNEQTEPKAKQMLCFWVTRRRTRVRREVRFVCSKKSKNRKIKSNEILVVFVAFSITMKSNYTINFLTFCGLRFFTSPQFYLPIIFPSSEMFSDLNLCIFCVVVFSNGRNLILNLTIRL